MGFSSDLDGFSSLRVDRLVPLATVSALFFFLDRVFLLLESVRPLAPPVDSGPLSSPAPHCRPLSRRAGRGCEAVSSAESVAALARGECGSSGVDSRPQPHRLVSPGGLAVSAAAGGEIDGGDVGLGAASDG